MSKDEILARVIEVLVETFEVEPARIQATTHMVDDLDLDSIDLIDLVVRLEEETGLDLAEDELRKLRVVQDVVDLVYRKLH